MEYKKAHEIRNKGLLSLIAENKFKKDMGFGSSIGSAISDKFKARAVGVKEKFDPMNIVRVLTGKGTFGNIATTIAGRAFGSSEKNISYFGGYARRLKNDQSMTNISPLEDYDGESESYSKSNLAGVLGEMYQFMQKTHEVDKKDFEIQQAYIEEQNSDAEIRHKQLVRAIKKYIKVPSSPAEENKGGGGFFDSIMNLWDKFKNTISGMIDNILQPIKKFMIGPIFAFLTGPIFSAFSSLLSGKTLANLTRLLLRMPVIAAGAAPLVVMSAVTDWLAPTEIGGNQKWQTDAINELHKKSGFEPTSTDVVPEEDLQPDAWYKNSGAKKARKTRIQKSIDEGLRTYSTGDADRIKKAYNIDVPKELIDVPKATPQSTKGAMSLNTPTTVKTSVNDSQPVTSPIASVPTAQPVTSTIASVPTAQPVTVLNTSIPTQLSAEPSTSSSSDAAVAITKTTNNIGGGPAQFFNMNPIQVRNSDLFNFLKKVSVPV